LVNVTTLPGQLLYVTSNRGSLEYVSTVWETKTELQDFPHMKKEAYKEKWTLRSRSKTLCKAVKFLSQTALKSGS
jgi:hypothetical protein